MFKRLKEDRASVLMAVIWMLAILAVFTVAVNRQASQELIMGPWMRDKVEASALARAGIARALLELQQDKFLTFDALNEKWANNKIAFSDIALGNGTFSVLCPDGGEDSSGKKSFRYGVCDESAKVNINTASELVLQRLVRAVEPAAEEKEAVEIAQSIIDWRDQDDAQLQSGAESTYYRGLSMPYDPRNGNFESVEELQMVKGIKKKFFVQIKPYVTVYTQSAININTASPIVLQALGVTPELSYKMVELRKGDDMIEGTKDDIVFQDVGGITPAMSVSTVFSSEDFASLANPISEKQVSVKSNTYRIHSVGRLKKDSHVYEHWITCVLTREGSVLYWHEGEGGED